MKKIEFVHVADMPFRKVSEFLPDAFLQQLSPDDRHAEVRTHFAGNDSRLALLEIKEPPHGQGALHAHEKDEIFFIVEGQMQFGHQICRAGDSISILSNTLYSFKTGPEGCRYLKFTAGSDPSFITQEQYRARQSA